MMFRPLVLAAGVVFAAAAQAESPDLLMAIEQAAHSGQAGEVLAVRLGDDVLAKVRHWARGQAQ